MASNFVLPNKFFSIPYQPLDYVFPKGSSYIQGSTDSAILLGLYGVGCTSSYDTTKDAVYCHTCVTGLLQKKIKYLYIYN